MSLKLFLWKKKSKINQFGFAVALAETENEAMEMLIKKAEYQGDWDDEFENELKKKPKVFERPSCYYFYGSW